MRVVIAVHGFPPTFSAGAELRSYRMARWLLKHGYQVGVICVESIDHKGPFVFSDDEVNGIPVRRLYFDLQATPAPERWQYDNPWIGEQVRTYLRESQAEVLHLISGYLMSASTIRAAHELGIPVVVTLTDFWFLCPRVTLWRSDGTLCAGPTELVRCARCLYEESRRYRFPAQLLPGGVAWLWRWLADKPTLGRYLGLPERLAVLEERRSTLIETLNMASVVICPSRFLREMFLTHGVSSLRLLFARQGVDLSGKPSAWTVTKSDGRLRIGYTGQLAEHKGVHILVQAFRSLKGTGVHPELVIYGNPARFPDYVSRLRRLAGSTDDIKFAGPYTHDEVWEVMSNLDVVVVPSIWYENSPNAILEAFAAGVPVVASDLGGMAELVHHGGNGLLFRPGDATDLAHQLQKLVDDPDLITTFRACIEPVKSVEQEMQELLDIYQMVTEEETSLGGGADDGDNAFGWGHNSTI